MYKTFDHQVTINVFCFPFYETKGMSVVTATAKPALLYSYPPRSHFTDIAGSEPMTRFRAVFVDRKFNNRKEIRNFFDRKGVEGNENKRNNFSTTTAFHVVAISNTILIRIKQASICSVHRVYFVDLSEENTIFVTLSKSKYK